MSTAGTTPSMPFLLLKLKHPTGKTHNHTTRQIDQVVHFVLGFVESSTQTNKCSQKIQSTIRVDLNAKFPQMDKQLSKQVVLIPSV